MNQLYLQYDQHTQTKKWREEEKNKTRWHWHTERMGSNCSHGCNAVSIQHSVNDVCEAVNLVNVVGLDMFIVWPLYVINALHIYRLRMCVSVWMSIAFAQKKKVVTVLVNYCGDVFGSDSFAWWKLCSSLPSIHECNLLPCASQFIWNFFIVCMCCMTWMIFNHIHPGLKTFLIDFSEWLDCKLFSILLIPNSL